VHFANREYFLYFTPRIFAVVSGSDGGGTVVWDITACNPLKVKVLFITTAVKTSNPND
jgi:hypothetical protein